MPDIIRQEWQNDVLVTWLHDATSDDFFIDYWQDVQHERDLIDAINAEGAPTIDGLGKPLMSIPITLAMKYCQARGIPWEKLLYSNDYDDEYRLLVKEFSRLAYHSSKSVHAVS